jgi:hypothetical protein
MGKKKSSIATRLALVLFAGLCLAAPAVAQNNTTNGNGATAWTPWWDVTAGYEGDSRDTGYAFVGPGYTHPLSDSTAIVGRLTFNYLTYEFDNGDATRTHVSGPGIAPTVGLRFGRRSNLTVTAGPEWKRREREVMTPADIRLSETDDDKLGARFGASLYDDFADHWNVHALASYGTAEDWLWTRVGVKRQLTNLNWRRPISLFLGAEGIAQGNDDIRQWQAGGLAEVVHAPSSLSVMVRAGWKNSSFQHAEDDNGAYFGIGLYRRF